MSKLKLNVSLILDSFTEKDWMDTKRKMEKNCPEMEIENMTLDEFKEFSEFVSSPLDKIIEKVEAGEYNSSLRKIGRTLH